MEGQGREKLQRRLLSSPLPHRMGARHQSARTGQRSRRLTRDADVWLLSGASDGRGGVLSLQCVSTVRKHPSY